MSDEQQCPECRGLRYAWEVVANGVGGWPPEKTPCPACGGTGKIPAEKLRDTGTGQEGLPADLIDRAVEALDRAAHRQTIAVHGYSGAGKPMTGPDGQVLWSLKVGVLAAAPLLVEHGRQQEREKWETRVEKEAEWRGSASGDRYTGRGVARLLRSLLAPEGEE